MDLPPQCHRVRDWNYSSRNNIRFTTLYNETYRYTVKQRTFLLAPKYTFNIGHIASDDWWVLISLNMLNMIFDNRTIETTQTTAKAFRLSRQRNPPILLPRRWGRWFVEYLSAWLADTPAALLARAPSINSTHMQHPQQKPGKNRNNIKQKQISSHKIHLTSDKAQIMQAERE